MEKWIIARHNSKEENISIEMFSGSKTEIINLLKEKSESDINENQDGYQEAVFTKMQKQSYALF